jgi:glucose-6-phosphate 1-dehydrogenase
MSSQTDPCTYIIFGSTGNLARTKLLPALYHLEAVGCLPENTTILGLGRRPWNTESWRETVRTDLQDKLGSEFSTKIFDKLVDRLNYFQLDLSDQTGYQQLAKELEDNSIYSSNLVFYLSIAPEFYASVSRSLAESGLNNEASGWRRLVVEKPFGYDLENARILDASLHNDFSENQIYRIDHYLGKETVQNIFVFRFANLMMEPLWNRNYIDHVQITHAETQGIGTRAGYFDEAGALRDMVQSHLLQMLTMVAMEAPPVLDSESIRDEKVKVLKSIRPIRRSTVHAQSFRGQYSAGEVDGEKVAGYLQEDGVPAKSTTETYAAMKLYIDNWRWNGVPFYLRTGKRMGNTTSMVNIRFKHPPQQLFRETQVQRFEPNWLLFGIQPEQCIRAEMQVRDNGLDVSTRTTQLDASSHNHNGHNIDAYESLLLDTIEGDRSLFLRSDEVDWAWRVVDPVLKVWATEHEFIHTYPAGTWGPAETERLFDKEDHRWRNSLS